MTTRGRRLHHRLLVHHLPLCLISLASVVALYYARPVRDTISRVSFATAYPALVLLAITLLIGPWNVLRKRRNPVSSDLRRDIGIWAGVLGVIHTVVGQNVHLRGRPWLYYVYAASQHKMFPLRHDLFGFSNYTGAASALVLVMLLATSNDYALRRLGTPNWKQLQRWNYLAFALAAAHALGYQHTEKLRLPFVLMVWLSIAITAAIQSAGYFIRRAMAAR